MVTSLGAGELPMMKLKGVMKKLPLAQGLQKTARRVRAVRVAFADPRRKVAESASTMDWFSETANSRDARAGDPNDH